jgi:hypothetical protein
LKELDYISGLEFAAFAKGFPYDIDKDITEVQAELKPWYQLSFHLITMEHYTRAMSFLSCCYPLNQNRLKIFVDNYGSLEDQENEIDKCVSSLTGTDITKCADDRNMVQDVRNALMK